MKRIISMFLLVASSLVSCVSTAEHDKIILEKNAVVEERDNLKQELEEIKYGAPNLLSDGVKFYEAQEFSRAREKFELLLAKHPDMPQSLSASKYLLTIDEEEAWNAAINSDDTLYAERYLSKFPNGGHVKEVNIHFKKIKVANLQKAYDAALNENKSATWTKFLESYPNHNKAKEIRNKIIRLAVAEISNDEKTGRMPSLTQTDFTSSPSSTVEIKNNTGCELIVRYSGPDAKMITISAGQTGKMYLSSGRYQVAASACNANYAGEETLGGEYNSTFYIQTSRY